MRCAATGRSAPRAGTSASACRTHLALEELRHHLRSPASRLGSEKWRSFTSFEIAHDERGQRREAIRHHHRQAVQHAPAVSRCRRRSARIGRSQRQVRLPVQQAHVGAGGAQLRVEATRRAQATPSAPRSAADGPAAAAAAPWQRRNRRPGDASRPSRLPGSTATTSSCSPGHSHAGAAAALSAPAECGLPADGRRTPPHRLPRIALRLERQQAQHGIHGACDRLHPPAAPGPHLRADDMRGADAARRAASAPAPG